MPAGDDAIRKGIAKGSRFSGGAPMMVLYSTTIFVSAALLFLIEPMFAKFVLPSFGGTPAVWTGSMMFFQAALLGSYLYTHATTSWLGARRQAWLHLAVVLSPLVLFALAGPIDVPAEEWAPPAGENPIFWLFGLLLVAVGLPFFAVSATNPLIQRWISATDHPSARDPYFLYRASNLGSILGLLGYPLLMEPNLRLADQGVFWTIGYGLLVVLVLASAVVLWRSPPSVATEEGDPATAAVASPNPPVAAGGGAPETGAPLSDAFAAGLPGSPTLLRRLRWIGLAFVPSSLMLGVTAFITTDITPVPLLWVIPLSLYLFSFVVVFSRNQRVPNLVHRVMIAALPITLSLLVVATITDVNEPLWLFIPLHLFGFFVAAMVLHGELARDRPPAARHLTEFYLWVAVGGVLGGVFNALIAPVVFDTLIEYPLVMALACLFLPRPRRSGRRDEGGSPTARRRLDLALPLALGLTVWTLLSVAGSAALEGEEIWMPLILSLAVGLALNFAYTGDRPVRFGLSIVALVVAAALRIGAGHDVLYEDRSFFGVYSVTGEEAVGLHTLYNGSTSHGAQVLGVTPPEPIGYYYRTGPVGQIFDALPSEDATSSRVAVLGLGAGAMACYAQPGQQWTFYEIDPLVERVARDPDLFTYLRDCPGEYHVVLGDARLSLRDAEDASYGVIVGDVFSSDAIPVHLLTREAIDLYFRKLAPNGVLAMHISNRYLNLEPVLGDLARERGLECYAQSDRETESVPHKEASRWVAMAREEADLGSLPDDQRWQPCATNPDSNEVWTDDFSNLIGALDPH